VLIEIDTDGHRSGVSRTRRSWSRSAARCRRRGSREGRDDARRRFLRLPHARGAAGDGRTGALRRRAAAERLRAAGIEAPVVSVGSTPTALFAEQLDGVTEVRAGVFVFFDLVMAGIGVCAVDDIALSVLGTVIGHRRQGLDPGGRGLDGDVARPRHGRPAGGPGLWPGLRRSTASRWTT
jgi:D-serine deaminase-like pyridoxal phosphate-dependent protein